MAKPSRCPACGEHEVVPLVFGLPTPEMMEARERGEVLMGGCTVMDGFDPAYQCKNCATEFEKRP